MLRDVHRRLAGSRAGYYTGPGLELLRPVQIIEVECASRADEDPEDCGIYSPCGAHASVSRGHTHQLVYEGEAELEYGGRKHFAEA